MTTPPATVHHVPLSERIILAPDAARVWQPARIRSWSAWKDELDDETIAVYRALRRSCDGKEHFAGLNDLKHSVQLGYPGLLGALEDLDLARLITLRRSRRGTIISIEVNEPPTLPPEEQMESLRRKFQRNRPRARTSDVNVLIWYWRKKWMQHRHTVYQGHRAKDRSAVRSLLDRQTLDHAKRVCWYLLHAGVGGDVLPYDRVSITSFVAKFDEIVASKKADEQPSARIR